MEQSSQTDVLGSDIEEAREHPAVHWHSRYWEARQDLSRHHSLEKQLIAENQNLKSVNQRYKGLIDKLASHLKASITHRNELTSALDKSQKERIDLETKLLAAESELNTERTKNEVATNVASVFSDTLAEMVAHMNALADNPDYDPFSDLSNPTEPQALDAQVDGLQLE